MINHKLFKGTEDINIKPVKYNKDSILFYEGELCNKIFLIISGKVGISTITITDQEYTFNVLTQNDIFGDSLCFSNNPYYLGDGICLEDSLLVILNKDEFTNLLKKEVILNNYLKYSAERNLKIREQIKLLSQQSIKDRILFYLQTRTKNIKSNVVKIESKELLAKYLNVQRPSLSRELMRMKEEGLIEYDKHSIKLLK